ncbi:hypothetical protein D3C80_1123420 [compost metagenome]
MRNQLALFSLDSQLCFFSGGTAANTDFQTLFSVGSVSLNLSVSNKCDEILPVPEIREQIACHLICGNREARKIISCSVQTKNSGFGSQENAVSDQNWIADCFGFQRLAPKNLLAANEIQGIGLSKRNQVIGTRNRS